MLFARFLDYFENSINNSRISSFDIFPDFKIDASSSFEIGFLVSRRFKSSLPMEKAVIGLIRLGSSSRWVSRANVDVHINDVTSESFRIRFVQI
jgi:hypothetical protein